MPSVDQELAARLELLRGICFSFLYDLCCWLARARQPISVDTVEYGRAELAEMSDPVERLRHYVAPELLDRWAQALCPFFEQGLRLAPELGDTGPLREEGLEDGGPVRAEVRFANRSFAVDGQQRRHALPRQEWELTLWIASDLGRVGDATLRPVEAS